MATKIPPITEPVQANTVNTAIEQPVSVAVKYSLIELPIGPLPGYVTRRVDVGRMTTKQSEVLAGLTSGLQHVSAKLADGTVVKSELHAIKYVLENLTGE